MLELQRNALMMFTSCGWFFNDLSGIETIQILKYARRVIELGEHYSTTDWENAVSAAPIQSEEQYAQMKGTARTSTEICPRKSRIVEVKPEAFLDCMPPFRLDKTTLPSSSAISAALLLC